MSPSQQLAADSTYAGLLFVAVVVLKSCIAIIAGILLVYAVAAGAPN